MFRRIFNLLPHAIAIFASAVFLDSLRYKFTNAPETQVIFGKLDAWAGTIGLPGLFSPSGLFSQYMIGTAELFAATLLLLGIIPGLRGLQALGGLGAFAIMSGAVSFHLFTPLGIDPNNDGGGLFAAAVIIWSSALILMAIRYREFGRIIGGFSALKP